jgi:cell division protein FtsB
MSPRFHRVLLSLFPALILALVAVAAVWGDNGVLARHSLQLDLEREKGDLAKIDRDNARLLRELDIEGGDRVLVERAVAEEIGWASEGTTIYRFDDAPSRP